MFLDSNPVWGVPSAVSNLLETPPKKGEAKEPLWLVLGFGEVDGWVRKSRSRA